MGETEFVDVSQHGEAGILAGLVRPDWPRFLVDVGAHDGRSLSNSFPFLQLGWAGVLVEPLPAAFERLVSLYDGRSDLRCVQAACAGEEGEMPLAVGSDAPLAMTSSLRPGARGGRQVNVRVRTLTGLLSECDAPPDFSLLLVDAEGMDHEVLAGLDFERWRPRVVVTEDRATDLLSARGYVLYTVMGATNAIWLRADLCEGEPARPGEPLISPAEAMRTVPREILERRCLELERSRDEIWQRLMVVETSRSWALTRPLRSLVRRLRG
ncbi:MAG TPA: FkbM family methyltransferase [Thermoleophilaceae bacterium]